MYLLWTLALDCFFDDHLHQLPTERETTTGMKRLDTKGTPKKDVPGQYILDPDNVILIYE